VGENVVVFEHGPAFPWVIVSGYSMVLLLIGALWLASRRGPEISRRQGRLLFLASIFPVLTNLVYLFGVGGVEGVDWTSVTFSVSGLLFLVALYGTRFLDLVPIARHVIIERMSDCVLVLDTKNQLADFNPAAQKILGIDQSDLGSPIGIALPPWAENDRLSRRSGQTAPLKGFSYHAHNKVFDVRVTHLMDHRNVLYGKLVILVDVTERDQTRQALEQHIQEIQDLHKELDNAQEQVMEKQRALARLEERRRLGRDMHDSVNQSIHSLMLSSETLEVLLEKGESEKAIEIAGRIRQSGMQALKEIRLLVFEARSIPTLENADLVTALQERLNMVERRVGINAEIVCQDDPSGKSPPEWRENIYWLTIEALNNSLKHGRANKVTIQIRSNGPMLDVKIEDNGIGFDPARVQSGGLGMRTMRERAELINGSLNITSTPGQGTSVSVSTEIPHG
jgi:signal transduction histidine kinase